MSESRVSTEPKAATQMGQKRYTPEQIVHKLREVQVALSKGATVAQAAKKIGVTDYTYSDVWKGLPLPGLGKTQWGPVSWEEFYL